MAHHSLYRKYRPDTFDDVVGQRHIERTLRNAVAQGSVAHAYLFSGPRGTGKTTTARILAKALLCDLGPTSNPDGSCGACIEVSEGTHPDVIEMDAASQTGVDNVREEIISRVAYAPQRGRYKIYIIDEVHMLSTQAFNALLKTLEEPPPHVIFIMCTTHPQSVPETVRSRCQRFEFRPISAEDITDRLQYISEAEGLRVDRLALGLIARHADGGMRDAITSLEQVIAYTGGEVTIDDVEGMFGEVSTEALAGLLLQVARRNTAECFYWIANQADMGADLPELVKSLLAYVRDLYVTMLFPEGTNLVNVTDEDRIRLKTLGDTFEGPDRIARMIILLADLTGDMRRSTEPRMLFELALVRMSSTEGEYTLEALAERIERLERRVQGITPSAPGAVPAPAVHQPVVEPRVVSEVPALTSKPAVERPATSPNPAPAEPPHAESFSVEVGVPAGADDAKRKWRAVLAEIRKLKVSYHPFFMPADASYNDEGTLVLEWPESESYGLNAAGNDKELLEKALFSVYGREVPYLLRIASGRKPVPKPVAVVSAASELESPNYETEIAPDEALLGALSALGGTVVEISPMGGYSASTFEEESSITSMDQDEFLFDPEEVE